MHKLRFLLFSMVLLFTVPFTSVTRSVAAEGPAASPEKEQELLSILRSEAPRADKAIACKQLAIYGSGASAADLGKLLPDAELSSWARIALENIPGREVDDTLRSAAESLDGRLLVGTINSIGVRRDAGAVGVLIGKLKHADADVASAAAVALGRIANADAATALQTELASSAPEVRSAIAEGCVLCAERFATDGKSAEALSLYDAVRNADVSTQRKLEGTRGAILAQGDAGIPLLMEQLRSSDRTFLRLGLTVAREFPGSQIDQQLASELSTAEESHAALIVQAMADRKDTVVLAAVLKAAQQGPQAVRLSAVDALARVGDQTCLTSLLKIAVDADAELAQSAQTTLAVLPGETVDTQIVKLVDSAKGKTYPLLLDLIGKRRIDAVPTLLKAVANSDSEVRRAALIALGETVTLKDLNVLVSQVVSPANADDAAVAQQALKAASIRMPDREDCATELASAVDKSRAVPVKIVLLQILGAMGGTKSLATIDKAARSTDPQLQDASSRLLGEWMTEDAAPVLLELAKLSSNPFQVRAMRGYIRIARQFVLPEDQRMEMCQMAFDTARQTAEKKLVLDILKRYPTPAGFKLAAKAIAVPDLKADATETTLLIAQKLGTKGVDVKELLTSAGMDKMKIEIVKAEYGAGTTQKDVTEVLQKQIGDLPLIVLGSDGYNGSFGGDPVPGSVKQLKVQYKINGKAGEATFAENATIILPMPK